MANILAIAADHLFNAVKDTIKLRSLKRSDVETLINNDIRDHEKIVEILSLATDAEMKKWMKEKVEPNLRSINNKLKDRYGKYFASLQGKALGEERARPLGALLVANKKYISLLKEIRKNIDHIIETESMTIYECRMSHLNVLGIMRQSNMVLNYTVYLYTFLVKVGTGHLGLLPRYREEYILKNHDTVVKTVNNLLNKDANYSFLREVDTLRSRNADLVLGATGRFDFHNVAVISNYSISFLDNLLTALSCLNLFGAAMDLVEQYQLDKHQERVEMKEWLENHISLMKMDLEGVDHSSPEYKKTQDILEIYENRLNELDQEIAEFENS